MDVTLIAIDSDAERDRAHALVEKLMTSEHAADITQLEAQARLIEGYEKAKWRRRRPSTAELIKYLMDQHGVSRADLVPILGTRSRVSEVLSGRKELSMTMVQRLRARFHIPADVLLPVPRSTTAEGSGAADREGRSPV